MSLQIEKKWLGEESVDGEKVKILYGQSLKGTNASGSDVEIIKINSSGNAIVPQGVVASEAHVASGISAEAALRVSGDSSTLSSAQSYTNTKFNEEKGLRESADLTFVKLDGSRPMTSALSMGGVSVLNPVYKSSQYVSASYGQTINFTYTAEALTSGFNASNEEVIITSMEMMGGMPGGPGMGGMGGMPMQVTLAHFQNGSWSISRPDLIGSLTTPNSSCSFSFQYLGYNGSVDIQVVEKVSSLTSFKITNVANGTNSKDAINKSQLDALEIHVETQIGQEASARELAISALETSIDSDLTAETNARVSADNALSARLDTLEADEVTKAYVDSADLALDGKITTEKNRIDSILLASDADKDSFAEIVQLINSIDTANDSGFASYVLSNDAAVAALQTELDGTQTGAGLGSNGSYSVNTGVSYIGSATSLHDADKKLDVQLKVVADGLAQELLDRASEIASEASSRISADNALDARLDILEADPATKTYVDSQDASKLVEAKAYADAGILVEKNRAETAEGLLDGRLDVLEAKVIEEDVMFEVGVSGVVAGYIELAHTAEKIFKVCVGRLNTFKGVDYTLSIVDGKTKITWIGELASGGVSPLSTGDKIFVTYIH